MKTVELNKNSHVEINSKQNHLKTFQIAKNDTLNNNKKNISDPFINNKLLWINI